MLILVTGAGGFIGSHVCEELLRGGHRVRGLVRYTSHGSRGHLAEVSDEDDRLEVVYGDVRDAYQMEQIVQGCDVVLHLAALIGIPYSYVAPESYVATNVTGTLNILQACRKSRTRRLVVTSTSEVYGSALIVPMAETHPLQPQSPYSASKIAADSLAQSFARSFELPVMVLRPFNTYGPRQSARAIIPTILTQVLSGKETIELGDLSPRRDFTYVEDTARAFALAAETPGIDGETIHFGQGDSVSIGEIADRCIALVGRSVEIKTVALRRRPERSEVELLVCDATKARERLGWKPDVPLDEGLKRTAQYIERQLANYRPAEYSL
jgi:NAD dependent epimerase/dehydratase